MVVSSSVVKADDVASLLKKKTTALKQHRTLQIGDAVISAGQVLPAMYQETGFAPLWSDSAVIAQLMSEIRAIAQDGLRPEDYHLQRLEQLNRPLGDGVLRTGERVERDLLLTDSLIRLSFHLYYGKVDPRTLHPRWRVPSYIGNQDAAALLLRQIRGGRISDFLDGLRPRHLFYRNLSAALDRYRRIARSGGWVVIPDGPLIEKGSRDARVPLIRRRLLQTGDLPAGLPDSGDFFDAYLQDAVIRFQDRHRIALDGPAVEDVYGAVGPETLAHMNLTVDQLIDKIRVNMERGRWVLRNLPPYFIVADIAGFEVLLIEKEAVVWKARAQVGDAERETPVFQSAVAYMEINPTWTVPPGIIRDSILPALRK
jgi:murein L,D-transpeptidase YcbB/YkuD